jgi:NADH-quinone oxidoreductase subunit J
MIATIAFGVLAACLLLSASFVVRVANLVHAVLWLGVTLVITAALYVLLDASFLAGVQVLLYVGGVVTLMVFGVMLTRRHDGTAAVAGSTGAGRGILAAAVFFGVVAAAVSRGDLAGRGAQASTFELGSGLVTTHLLAFEVLSFLLLAAIIGAVVIARRRDPGAPVPDRVTRVRGPLAPEAARPDGGTP